MSTRQDSLEERLVSLDEKLTLLQEQLELLPDALTRCIAQHAERLEQRRNFLHPDAAVAMATGVGSGGCSGAMSPGNVTIGNSLQIGMSGSMGTTGHHALANLSTSPLLPHSRSVPSAPSAASLHPWPASPVLPPVSSRTPHLVPETGARHHSIIHPTTSQSVSRLASQGGMGGLGNSQGSDS